MNCVEYEYSVYYNVISYNHVGSWLVLGGYRDFFDCAEVVDEQFMFLTDQLGYDSPRRKESRDAHGRVWGVPNAGGRGQCLDCPKKAGRQ